MGDKFEDKHAYTGEQLKPMDKGCHFSCDIQRLLYAWRNDATPIDILYELAAAGALVCAMAQTTDMRFRAANWFLQSFQDVLNELHHKRPPTDAPTDGTRTSIAVDEQDTEGFKEEFMRSFIHMPGHS